MKTKFGNARVSQKGYYRITSSKEGNNGKSLHGLIWEDFYNTPIPQGYVIHHINREKTDNRIQNLQCVSISNHHKYHSSHMPKEAIKKRSIAMSGKKHPFYGKNLSENHKNNIRLSHLGKKISLDTRKKMSESHRGLFKGEKNPMYGKKLSKERKEKFNFKGKKHSQKTRERLREKNKNHGLFKTTGTHFNSHANPEKRCWACNLKIKGKKISLGYFEDPFSANLVYNLVKKEIMSVVV